LDIAIGVSLVLLFLSLAASATAELIEALVHQRARTLVKGITALVGEAWTQRLYQHPLVAGLSRASTELAANQMPSARKLPSYIPGTVFAQAMASELRKLARPEAPPASVRNLISALDDGRLKAALTALAPEGAHRVEDLLDSLADWY